MSLNEKLSHILHSMAIFIPYSTEIHQNKSNQNKADIDYYVLFTTGNLYLIHHLKKC